MSASRQITLIGDGSSDEALLPILRWLWNEHCPGNDDYFQFADLSMTGIESRKLGDVLPLVLDLYPCDVLFIHRDAEKDRPEKRLAEIGQAITSLNVPVPKYVRVIPVRMSEAWMLFDETAIRKAADNPNGKIPLRLPPLSKLESEPDPKLLLHHLLKQASGLPTGRLRRFNEGRAARLVTSYSQDFAPLRRLRAFQRLEEEVEVLVSEMIDKVSRRR